MGGHVGASLRHRTLTALVVLTLFGLASGQIDGSESLGFVTAQTGRGATRGLDGDPFDTRADSFSDVSNGLSVGDGVATYRDSTAVVTLPDYGAIVQLGGSTEFELTEDRLGGLGFPATMTISSGTVSVLRRGDADRWMLLVGQHRRNARNAGFVLVRNGSVTLTVDRSDISCLALAGEAIWFDGAPPAGPLINASGAVVPQGGLAIPQGSRVVAQRVDDRISQDVDSVSLAYSGVVDTMYAFGLDQGSQWVRQAEQGDFTPVRGSSRAAAEAFSAQVGVSQSAFDQPRSQVVAPAPTTSIRTVTAANSNPANALIASGIPSNVVVGQRLRRSRIIGNPGTTGVSGLRFNPNAEQLIRLSGSVR